MSDIEEPDLGDFDPGDVPDAASLSSSASSALSGVASVLEKVPAEEKAEAE
jgi:hypothetical protein